MKEKFLTKEGVLTDFAFKVYLSDDELYFHKNKSNINLYNIFKIKDINEMIPNEIVINDFVFHYPNINVLDLKITYEAKDDDDIYAIFKIDLNTFKNGFNLYNPFIKYFNRNNEIFEDLDINELDNFL